MMKYKTAARFGLSIVFMFVLVGCSPAATRSLPGGTIPLPTSTPPADETLVNPISPHPGGSPQMNTPLPTPAGAVLQSMIENAETDLAKRLGVSVDQVILVEASSVVWSDASLGCPQAGMQYAQVLSPGYLIRLESGGQVYEYHAGRSTTVFYCENPTPPVSGTPSDI